jgi:PEP-CTERM motif
MKMFPKAITGAIAMAAALALTGSNAQANLLSDPGFESGTPVPSGVGGWGIFNGAAFSTAQANTGIYSMLDSGPGGYTVPGSYQFLPSSAGLSYYLTGYGDATAPLTGASQGFLQITFFSGADGTGSNLGTVATSPGNAQPSNPITSTSPTGTWLPLNETVTAPAGTASIAVYTLVLDANATSVAFDDLNLVQVPEPSTPALLGMGLALPLYLIRRRK